MTPEALEFFKQHDYKNTFVYPPLPATTDLWAQFNFIMNDTRVPWLEIVGIDVPYKEMFAEAHALKDRFVFHRAEEGCHRGWRSLAIHGIASDKTNIPETYGLDPAQVKYTWTDIQDQCPATVNFFKNIMPYNSYQRVRFMLLEPGGYILPHSDNTRSCLGAAVNIALNNPTGCRLTTELGTAPFQDTGTILFFNNHYQHAVWNDSDQDRIHMVVHGTWNSERIMPIVINSYKQLLEN